MSQGCNPDLCKNESEKCKWYRSIIASLMELHHVSKAVVLPDDEARIDIFRLPSGAIEVRVI